MIHAALLSALTVEAAAPCVALPAAGPGAHTPVGTEVAAVKVGLAADVPARAIGVASTVLEPPGPSSVERPAKAPTAAPEDPRRLMAAPSASGRKTVTAAVQEAASASAALRATSKRRCKALGSVADPGRAVAAGPHVAPEPGTDVGLSSLAQASRVRPGRAACIPTD